MQTEHAIARDQDLRSPPSRRLVLARFMPFLFYAFVLITAVAVFVPLDPGMPREGIDPSYNFAMNQAVARQLTFGNQIVFTYGPYASVGSRLYDPATDFRMMCGTLCFGVSFILGILFLANGRGRYLIVTLLLFAATFGPGELLLLARTHFSSCSA